MARKIRLTHTAAQEILNHITYLQGQSQRVAEAVWDALDMAFLYLEKHPFMGQELEAHAKVKPGTRRYVLLPYPYLILYRVSDQEIIIDSVVHGKENYLEA